MIFHDFMGNEGVKEKLSSYEEGDRPPHAIIFEGQKGCGKKTLARLFAAALLCKSEGGRPCLNCDSCKKSAAGSHPDIIVNSGGESARSFHIDKIREIRSDAFIMPNESDKKLFLLFDAHLMSEQAQNSLLKILEEPPRGVIFILTCEYSSYILPTIRSRCQIFALAPVSERDTLSFFSKKMPDVSHQRVVEAYEIWGGIIGKIKESLEDGKISMASEFVREYAEALAFSNEMELLAKTAVFEKDKELFKLCVPLLISLLRDALAIQVGVRAELSGWAKEAGALAMKHTKNQIFAMMDVLKEIEIGFDRNANSSILITRFCSSLKRASEI